MPSIFDVPVTARMFNASDWLAAIDVKLQAPPSAPADEAEQIADDWPTAEPPIQDSGLWKATQPAATRRRVRNLPWAIVATCAAMIWTLLVVGTFGGTPALLWAVLAACVLELLIWLGLAWRFDRL